MIVGKVIHGDGIGKSQGYATANLNIGPEKTQLKRGCYAAIAHWRGQNHPAALIVGSAPGKVEVHIIDYAGADFYGEEIIIEAVQKVSETVAADSVPELKTKMDQDIARIRSVLARQGMGSGEE